LSVEFEGNLSTDDAKKMKCPKLPFDQGIVVSGRAPVWLLAAIAHEYHPAQWVATHDPRLGGGVIIMAHVQGVAPFDVIKF
jgi:CRISPR-associated protein Csx3